MTPFSLTHSPLFISIFPFTTTLTIGVAGTNQERTFLAVKPDGVQRG